VFLFLYYYFKQIKNDPFTNNRPANSPERHPPFMTIMKYASGRYPGPDAANDL
jgi:hypothetical protein